MTRHGRRLGIIRGRFRPLEWIFHGILGEFFHGFGHESRRGVRFPDFFLIRAPEHIGFALFAAELDGDLLPLPVRRRLFFRSRGRLRQGSRLVADGLVRGDPFFLRTGEAIPGTRFFQFPAFLFCRRCSPFFLQGLQIAFEERFVLLAGRPSGGGGRLLAQSFIRPGFTAFLFQRGQNDLFLFLVQFNLLIVFNIRGEILLGGLHLAKLGEIFLFGEQLVQFFLVFRRELRLHFRLLGGNDLLLIDLLIAEIFFPEIIVLRLAVHAFRGDGLNRPACARGFDRRDFLVRE